MLCTKSLVLAFSQSADRDRSSPCAWRTVHRTPLPTEGVFLHSDLGDTPTAGGNTPNSVCGSLSIVPDARRPPAPTSYRPAHRAPNTASAHAWANGKLKHRHSPRYPQSERLVRHGKPPLRPPPRWPCAVEYSSSAAPGPSDCLPTPQAILFTLRSHR